MTKKSQSIIFSLISFFLPVIALFGTFWFTDFDYVRIELFLACFISVTLVAEALNIWFFNSTLTAREKRPGLISFVSGLSLSITIYTLLYFLLKAMSGAIMNN